MSVGERVLASLFFMLIILVCVLTWRSLSACCLVIV
jgi:hypothetical protein